MTYSDFRGTDGGCAGVPVARVVLREDRRGMVPLRHPWIRETTIASIDGVAADGEVVDLVTAKGRFLGRGIFNSRSRIRVRLYTWNESEPLDERFWTSRIDRAIELRRLAGFLSIDTAHGGDGTTTHGTNARGDATSTSVATEAMRLINSEGDGLSGLVVDRYGDFLVVQVTALAIALRLPMLLPILKHRTGAMEIFTRSEPYTAKLEGMSPEIGGATEPVESRPPIVVCDVGLRYEMSPWMPGQKTGLYLDQRENRLAAARLFGGRRVLDMFCHHGGFGLAALRAGATHVTAVDASAPAIAQLCRNMTLNGFGGEEENGGDRYTPVRADAFAFLEQRLATWRNAVAEKGGVTKSDESTRWGGVVLDPPKFARSKANLHEALRGYHLLNRLGISLVEPGGILVTCSCSGAVSRDDFAQMLGRAAAQAGRELQILEQRGATMDHPVAVGCPEGEYLKCFICRVNG